MCLIIASPTGKRISDAVLDDAERVNTHGGGIAWHDLTAKRIQFRKGLDADKIKVILDTEVKNQPWVVHFRIATVGGVSDELTHPFTIDKEPSLDMEGNADAVLFHNGGFPQWKDYLLQASARSGITLPEPPWSDSRAIAFCLHVYGKHLLSLLDNHSRFLVFDAKDVSGKRIMLWGDWADCGDFKFSHRGSCAFNTHSQYNPNNQKSHGGGSENPTKAAAANESDAGTESAENTSSPISAQTSGSPQSSTATVSRFPATTRNTKAFQPKVGFDPWKKMSATGLYVRADNEPAMSNA